MRAAVLSIFVGLSSVALAHPEWSPIRVNRYAKIIVAESSTKLVYTILYGEGPALSARKTADLDGNGHLDDRERAMLGARAAMSVQAGLRVTLDDKPFSLPTPTVDVGLAGDLVSAEPYSVDLTYAIPMSRRIVIDDHVEVPNEGDTEVSIDAAVPLRSVHRGATGTGVEKVFTFRGPRFSALEDRSVMIELDEKPTTPWRAYGAVALGAALIVGVGAWLRRRATSA